MRFNYKLLISILSFFKIFSDECVLKIYIEGHGNGVTN